MTSGVVLDLDYLVIGTFASQDWAHNNYGRKIEKSIKYNEDGRANIAIISEDAWADALCARPDL